MPIIDPLRDYPGYALRRASALSMQRLARRLAALQLRPSEASVLLVIESNPGISQSEIGRLLDIAGANMAPLVSGLSDQEWVVRRQLDGRSQALTLAAAGKKLCPRVREVMRAHEDELLTRVPASLRSAFIAALQVLRVEEE